MESVGRQGLIEEQFSIEEIRKLFSYDPETGLITRIENYGRAKKGETFDGSHGISVMGANVRSGRLAWALHNGAWPPEGFFVDHISGVKADNRLCNLRLATPTQNQQNKARCGNYGLPKGVTLRLEGSRRKPYQARIRVNGERILLGSFATQEEAAAAYREAAIQYHGEFACYD